MSTGIVDGADALHNDQQQDPLCGAVRGGLDRQHRNKRRREDAADADQSRTESEDRQDREVDARMGAEVSRVNPRR